MSDGKSRACCQALKKNGEPCGTAPMEGGLCFFHANPNKAAELGRIGGQSKRRIESNNADRPPLWTAKEVGTAVCDVAYKVYLGELSPKVASCTGITLSVAVARKRSGLPRK